MNQSIPNNNLIIYITDNEELDKVLNSIKAKSFQLISAIIQYGSTDIKNATVRDISYSLIDVVIKNLDYFRKVSPEHTKPTVIGGLVSIASMTVIGLLAFYEINEFLKPHIKKDTFIAQDPH
jgi:hypothetical protein